jgi:hypothetical protein
MIVLLSCSAAKSQWYTGTSVRVLSDAKSFGVSLEVGKQYSFGYLFLQGAYINRQFTYEQTFTGLLNTGYYVGYGIGINEVSFPQAGVIDGRFFDAGTYPAQTYVAYFPKGPEFVFSASYCYPLFNFMMLGPTIGVVFQNQAPIYAARDIGGFESLAPLYGPAITNGLNSSSAVPNKRLIFGNFGGCIKISLFSANPNTSLLILEYATQTGTGLGLEVPI